MYRTWPCGEPPDNPVRSKRSASAIQADRPAHPLSLLGLNSAALEKCVCASPLIERGSAITIRNSQSPRHFTFEAGAPDCRLQLSFYARALSDARMSGHDDSVYVRDVTARPNI